jgi:AraC-like DNA-binding protein
VRLCAGGAAFGDSDFIIEPAAHVLTRTAIRSLAGDRRSFGDAAGLRTADCGIVALPAVSAWAYATACAAEVPRVILARVHRRRPDMAAKSKLRAAAAEIGANAAPDALLRIDAVRKFADIVAALGGNPAALLAQVQIDPASLDNPHAMIPHRALAQLLENAAAALQCPDFGMRLAAAQGGLKVLGPLEYAMRNSRTVRAAFRYCVDHIQVYTTAAQMHYEERELDGAVFLHIDVLLPGRPDCPQTVERALLLSLHSALKLSDGRARAREVWFVHRPLAAVPVYEAHFGAGVRFGQRMNGLLFAAEDFDAPIPNVDSQVYEVAVDFIEHRFPAANAALSIRTRAIVERLLLAGDCSYGAVASMLGMHTRTLQRRLKAEGESFETIKDGVRRELALRYLQRTAVPLPRVAELLGYSETSALSRSCYRWFSASPREIRGHAGDGQHRSPVSAPPRLPNACSS